MYTAFRFVVSICSYKPFSIQRKKNEKNFVFFTNKAHVDIVHINNISYIHNPLSIHVDNIKRQKVHVVYVKLRKELNGNRFSFYCL